MMTASYEDIVTFVANQLKCPICFEIFTDPVTLECGHSYCLQCIKDHLKRTVRKKCPQCRAELRPDCKLHKNVTISTILELQEVGGRKMWDRVLTENEEELSQDALQRKLDFLKQEMEKIEMQAEFHSLIQNGTCFIRDNIRTYESSSSVEMLSSSLDCEGGSHCAENSLSLPSVTQIDKVVKNSESASEENQPSVPEDPDSLGGFCEGGMSAASALSAEFVSLSFPSSLCHRRLVFLDQRRRMEVRSSMPLRTRPCRFKACQCMAEQEFTTGRHYWDIETSACSGWAAGVAYTHLGQDERLGRSKSSWCIEWSSGSFSARHDSSETPLKQRHSSRLRVLLDMDSGHLSFWSGTDGEAELFDFRVEFRAPVRPVFWLFGTKPGNALSFPIP
ncbi:E3 ubiquitin/ISG15 ligase TRIM25 [Ictalurus punctatus]|uniref:E3 ubiquitin/ISG15 ligase TRIM25 n=1 Tax=Ictalurus punctatus TaxID=7998 RepID=A0A2D0S573_ICTPU|nr:E3 ubiquitin/ISG15 ligase TRIM25 [Ictalurus punctatus]